MARRRRRRTLLLLLSAVVLLSSCRSWHTYRDISVGDMRAGLQLYMQDIHPFSTLRTPDAEGEVEVEFSSEISVLAVLVCIIFTGGLILPLDTSHTVAVRPHTKGGSRIAVEAASRWLFFFGLPLRFHEEAREQRVRDAIVAYARRRPADHTMASEAVYELLEAVRQQDSAAFRGLLWTQQEHRSRAPEWLVDQAFWSDVHEWPTQGVTVSWPPHSRKRTTTALFGLVSNTERYECLWVDLKLGPKQQRFEVVKEGGRYVFVLPVSEYGRLER